MIWMISLAVKSGLTLGQMAIIGGIVLAVGIVSLGTGYGFGRSEKTRRRREYAKARERQSIRQNEYENIRNNNKMAEDELHSIQEEIEIAQTELDSSENEIVQEEIMPELIDNEEPSPIPLNPVDIKIEALREVIDHKDAELSSVKEQIAKLEAENDELRNAKLDNEEGELRNSFRYG